MYAHQKICLMIFDSFCVFLLEHFDVFWVFLLPPTMFDMAFYKNILG